MHYKKYKHYEIKYSMENIRLQIQYFMLIKAFAKKT